VSEMWKKARKKPIIITIPEGEYEVDPEEFYKLRDWVGEVFGLNVIIRGVENDEGADCE